MERFIAGLVEDIESGKVDLRFAFRVSRQVANLRDVWAVDAKFAWRTP
jgi:hypothetical protein